MIYEYLIFNLVVIFGPLLVFFWNKKWIVKPDLKAMSLSILLSSFLFAAWDQLVVNYFWSFNLKYITGLFLFDLPIEEVLFFISVPFACLLLWVNYKKYFNQRSFNNFPIYLVILILILVLPLLFYSKVYSASVLFVFLSVIALDIFWRTGFFVKQSFITFIFLVTNILTFIFNLYLTARPVVLYNEALKTNFNITTIPIEDFIFGMALIALTVIVYEKILLNYKKQL